MDHQKMSPADAVEKFKNRKIMVQTATPTTKPGRSVSGAATVVTAFDVKYEPLAVEHVLSAKENILDGRVSIVTIDGQRHEEPPRAPRREVE